jgi:hypothetical protein
MVLQHRENFTFTLPETCDRPEKPVLGYSFTVIWLKNKYSMNLKYFCVPSRDIARGK